MTLKMKARLSIDWLCTSIEATGYKGSSHIYSRWRYPLTGWHLGYPETTGYIIETLLDYQTVFPDLPLEDIAHQCGEWLLSQQLGQGAFPALLANNQTPSFFNSGMITFGLLRLEQKSFDPKRQDALEQLANWVTNRYKDHDWTTVPTYYFRAIWAYLLLAEHLQSQPLLQCCHQAIDIFTQKVTPQHAFRSWGFEGSDRAFTHTIAYTLRGCFEVGLLTQRGDLINKAANGFTSIMKTIHPEKGLAGSYDVSWQGDYSYRCSTGHAQLSVLGSRLFTHTRDDQMNNQAVWLLHSIWDDQITHALDKNLSGALPGSVPIWGPYMRLKYPNWAAKFFLDAILQIGNNHDAWQKEISQLDQRK